MITFLMLRRATVHHFSK